MGLECGAINLLRVALCESGLIAALVDCQNSKTTFSQPPNRAVSFIYFVCMWLIYYPYCAQVRCSTVFMQQPFKASISVEKWIMNRRRKHIWFKEKLTQNNADPCLNNGGFWSKAFKHTNTATIVVSLRFALRTIACKTCIGLSRLFLYLSLWD